MAENKSQLIDVEGLGVFLTNMRKEIPTVTVTPKVTTGTNIATITVNETDYELYASVSGGSISLAANDNYEALEA